jgi:hypothetical protein
LTAWRLLRGERSSKSCSYDPARRHTRETADRLENSIKRATPFGEDRQKQLTAAKLKLESTLRPKGRPKKCTGHL